MKSSIFAVAAIAAFSVARAADITGDYCTWLGHLAGINATGERSTVMGAGSGGEAKELVRTDFVGAAAGAYSSNLVNCTGIGFCSLLNASNMENVVAIGVNSFKDRQGLKNSTWLNGQFIAYGQLNTFAIRANNTTPDLTNAPIHYANGVLSFNADEVRINGKTTSGDGTSGSSAPNLAGYDLYVDPVNGNDDIFDGKSPTTAKKTIDGAYAMVTNHDATICLLPGEHTSLSAHLTGGSGADDVYPQWRIHLYGAYGKDDTIIDCKNNRLYWGYPDALFSSVQGCTIRNLGNRTNCPRLLGVYFYDCIIECGIASEAKNERGYYFAGCVLEKCEIKGDIAASGGNSRLWLSLFIDSDVFDSIVDITPTDDITYAPAFSYCSYLENCYIRTRRKLRRFGGANDAASILGNSNGMKDCTVISPGSAMEFVVPPSTGCLFGLGDTTNSIPTYSTLTGCVCTNEETVANIIGSDYRPPLGEWRYRFHGYESAAERTTKNAMENSIIDALLKNESLNISQTQTMSLMSVSRQNETEVAQQGGNRLTNAVTTLKYTLRDVEDTDTE